MPAKEKIHPDDISWTASWVTHVPFDQLPKRYQLDDFDYKIYKLGSKPLDFWIFLAKKLHLMSYNDHAYHKVWVDNVSKYHVALILHGESKIHKDYELNLANGNARALCQLLQIPTMGKMHPLSLLKKIERVKDSPLINEFTRDYSETQNKNPDVPLGLGNGPKMIDMGLSQEKIQRYLLRLEQICDHCIKHECDVAYG